MIFRNVILYMILFALSLSLGACHSQKSASGPASSIGTKENTHLTKETLAGYSTTWDKVKIPVTLRLKSPKNMSVSGQAILQRDKSVTLSFKFFGMEIALIHITPDSVLAIDKYNKRYISESLHDFLAGCPLNINNVQDALLGRPFLIGSDKAIDSELSKFNIDEPLNNNGVYTLIPKSQPKNIEYGFSLDSYLQLAALIVKAGQNAPVTISYGPPAKSHAGLFATSASIEANSGKTEIKAVIEWDINKAKWNDDVELRKVTLSKGYQRIDARKLLKLG